jgi:hypothetical protein
MQLREEIVEIIKQGCPVILDGDIDLTAKKVLKHLDSILSLDDNGWFDDDEDMLEFICR